MSVDTAQSIAPSARPAADASADRLPILSQWALFRRRFKRHRLARISAVIVALFYFVVVFADFLAYSNPALSNAQRTMVPPQPVHLFADGGFLPHVNGLIRSRDSKTLDIRYVADPKVRIPIVLFAHGYEYRLFGLIPTTVHLIGTRGARTESSLFVLGSDLLGRDLFSRLMVAIRTSLVIGLSAVCVSLVLGMIMGSIAGFYGGTIDSSIQRLIEILRSIPTIPLWMGLAAAIPAEWGITTVYLAVTLIIALIGWTELARELRGRIISLRHEDFVLAAELCGARPRRIIFVHLLPSCMSHIIATTTLALPAMIASETALGFLGLGLRPPAISLGVLLNGAQNIQSLALYPWLMWPAASTALIILSFNFLGDGLRDAADPYA